jgi:hypothetical protein
LPSRNDAFRGCSSKSDEHARDRWQDGVDAAVRRRMRPELRPVIGAGAGGMTSLEIICAVAVPARRRSIDCPLRTVDDPLRL